MKNNFSSRLKIAILFVFLESRGISLTNCMFCRTQTNVEMFVLKKKDLDVVLSHYPQIKKQIIETAEERQRLVKERAAAFAKKKKEEEEAAKRKKEEEDANRAAGISADDANDKENEGGDGKKNENGGEAANTSAESEVRDISFLIIMYYLSVSRRFQISKAMLWHITWELGLVWSNLFGVYPLRNRSLLNINFLVLL